ncbi:hypothetical protein LL912_22520 [Niabella sp. CC-SYL272]|uniref:hypothetical protein n=1 Tax=Niabella agricola TaxID=2891571 RepID=UPI001F1E3CF3|nr:hypothetical protein [Niabella agricola]MCF3111578.1 hypothetical protein [Niabella agricola]
MKYFFWLGVMLLAVSCAKRTAPAIDTNGTVISLALHEKKAYGNITIAVSRIQESRCPMNARCIRAGEAIADLTISDEKSSAAVSLCTGTDCGMQKKEAQATAILSTHQYQLSLVDILPNPTKTLEKGTQKVLFSIRKIQ